MGILIKFPCFEYIGKNLEEKCKKMKQEDGLE